MARAFIEAKDAGHGGGRARKTGLANRPLHPRRCRRATL